jgi:hypothetical protein
MKKIILRIGENNSLMITVVSSWVEKNNIPVMEVALKNCNEGEPFWIVDKEEFEKEYNKFEIKTGLELDLEVLGEPSGYGAASTDYPEHILKGIKVGK